MSAYVYRHGGDYVVVQTYMPGVPVRLGIGETIAEAVRSLAETPIQSGGRASEDVAVEWALCQGVIDDADDVGVHYSHEIDVDDYADDEGAERRYVGDGDGY